MYFIHEEQVGSSGRYHGAPITPSYLTNPLVDICHGFFTLSKVSWAKHYLSLICNKGKRARRDDSISSVQAQVEMW